eukprot:TRINITY_DN3433_c0_g4_i1.p1 TRINITY_DN3433_c0_g4~~TRINITY_DN3433_c0_g4_i1.p1  ORF type:complete len:1246 (+),score=344.03 TRINITY_DN3433_c0_g4_i1:113-3850(+)
MFLSHCGELGLLQTDPNTNILGAFSLGVKKNVTIQIVSFILESTNVKTLLPTDSHVQWVMEVVGQGFQLPLEEEAVIASCIDLYKRWLLEGSESKPVPIAQDTKQIFVQNILKQYSMMFQPRRTDRSLSEMQAKLCFKVLQIFVNFGRDKGKNLTVETWEIWLKLLMGINNQLFAATGSDDALASLIAPNLMKVTFELWMLSGTRNPEMWGKLRSLLGNWQILPMVAQWNATCAGLANTVLALLYGHSEGCLAIIIGTDDPFTVDLTSEYVFYTWYRMFTIIDNPNHFTDPKIFLEAMKGINHLVTLFLNIGTRSKQKIQPPDGNTILHIFGAWLFEAIKLNRPSFDEGTALAIEILCKIFKAKIHTKFEPIYLASYYSCISDVLQKEGRVLIACLVHNRDFFTQELEGCRILVPYFVYAISGQLTKTKSNFEHILPFDQVREACISILGSLLSLSGFYGQTKMATRIAKEAQVKQEQLLSSEKESKLPPLPEITTYSALKPYLTQILLKGLRAESDPNNISQLLWLMVVHLHEIVEDPQAFDFAHGAIEIILSRTTGSNNWPIKVMISAYKVLGNFVTLAPRLPKLLTETSTVVTSLCKFISAQVQELSSPSDEIMRPLIAAYFTITDWIMGSEILFSDQFGVSLLLSTIGSTLGTAKTAASSPTSRGFSLDDDLKDAAQYCLYNFLNNSGNFPPKSGARNLSTLLNEEIILENLTSQGLEDARKYLRYFIVENSFIIAAIDLPLHKEGPSCMLLIRDKTGRYAWDASLIYTPDHEVLVKAVGHAPPPPVLTPMVPPLSGKKVDDSNFKDLLASLQAKKRQDNVNDLTHKVAQMETTTLQSKNYGLSPDVSILPPKGSVEKMYSHNSKFQAARLLLSHLGFLNLEGRGRVFPLEQGSSFFSTLKTLDAMPERYCQKVSVLYVGQGQKSDQEILANFGVGSLEYREFVSGLGWGVNVNTHPGYLGGIDRSQGVLPYHASYANETIFHVASLMSSEDQKRAILPKDYVTVMWVEDEVTNLSLFDNLVKTCPFIVAIHPLPSGLYHLRLVSREIKDVKSLGPLRDNLITRKEMLASLVRLTCINVYREIQAIKEGSIKPYEIRRRLIEEMSSRFRREETIDQFLMSSYMGLPESSLKSPVNLRESASDALANRRWSSVTPEKSRASPPLKEQSPQVSMPNLTASDGPISPRSGNATGPNAKQTAFGNRTTLSSINLGQRNSSPAPAPTPPKASGSPTSPRIGRPAPK